MNDSIDPIAAAGQMQLVDDGFAVDDALTVQAAPGHTLGHVIIRAHSLGQTGIFSGDVIHHSVQLQFPDISIRFCVDPAMASATRHQLLCDCADNGYVLFPGHFGGTHHGRVARHEKVFRWRPAGWDDRHEIGTRSGDDGEHAQRTAWQSGVLDARTAFLSPVMSRAATLRGCQRRNNSRPVNPRS